MNTFSLDNTNAQISFKLNAIESYIHIYTIALITFGSTNKEWINIYPKLELTAELKYFVYADSNDIQIDIRSFSIPITIDPAQSQPIFNINRTIQNESFTIGNNPEKKSYSTLKLELKETEAISEKYELRLEVKMHKVVDNYNQS